jgi:hypothetical protein
MSTKIMNTVRNGTTPLTVFSFTKEVMRHLTYKSCEWWMPNGCHCSLRTVTDAVDQWMLSVSRPEPGAPICAGKVTHMDFAKAEKLIGWALRTGKLVTHRSR